MAYDAFISYSHAGDGLLAPRVQDALGRFAKPWWRRRALRVFRDESALSANPGLWSSITEALDASEWFVLLASPDSAESGWVNREIEYWCANHDPRRVLPVVTEGEWKWDESTGDFDWAACTAVPLALRGVFTEEPRHIDMRWARSDAQLDLHNGRFRDQIAQLAAPMHGLAKDDLAGEDVREHRRTLRIAWGAVALLLLLLTASVASALVAVSSANDARASEKDAVDARVEADRQAALAVASADEAQQRRREADESATEAGLQRTQADASAREADRQRAEADRNAATAEAQRRAADTASAQLAETVDALTATNVDLDQANEDLASSNEQLDQTNQALASTNKELDQTNAELGSTNGQLRNANDTLTAQAANLDASRLAGLATEQMPTRLDVAMLLAAEAQNRAATDSRLPMSTLFRILQAEGRGLDRVLHTTPADDTPPVVAVSPDDQWLAMVTQSAAALELSIWAGDAPAGTPPRTFGLDAGYPYRAAFAAGGRFLVLETVLESSVDPDAPVIVDGIGATVIDTSTGTQVLSFAPVKQGRVSMSLDREFVAVQTCLPEGADVCEPTVALIDARSGLLIRERPGLLASALGVADAQTPLGTGSNIDFSPDGTKLIAFAEGEFQIWYPERPAVTTSLYTPAAGSFTVPSFDAGSEIVASSPSAGQTRLYDAQDGSVRRTIALVSDGPVSAVATIGGGELVAVLQPGALHIVDTEGQSVAAVDSCATGVRMSPREQWLVTSGPTCTRTDPRRNTDEASRWPPRWAHRRRGCARRCARNHRLPLHASNRSR